MAGKLIMWVLSFAISLSATVAVAVGPAERSELLIGFIKLTDMAPLAIAQEKGFFEDEGLDVLLEAQHSWDQVIESLIGGGLDGAHMLAGQPLAAKVGYGLVQGDVVTPFSMDLNGNAITVSNSVWEAIRPGLAMGDDGKPLHPIKADVLGPVIETFKARNEPFKLAMVFPVSTHNYELRYWLAGGGIHPGFYSSDPPGPQRLDRCRCPSLRPHRRPRCQEICHAAEFRATAWENPGTSRPFSTAWAYLSSRTPISGRTIRRRYSE